MLFKLNICNGLDNDMYITNMDILMRSSLIN